MRVWPRMSMRVEAVCWEIFEEMLLGSSSLRALFKILTFTISLFSRCLEISFTVFGVAPSFPIHTVGLSPLSSLFIRRLILGVIMFSPFSSRVCACAFHN